MSEIYTDLERKKVSFKDELNILTDASEEKITLKVIEEATELNEVLVKRLTKREDLKPPIEKVIEEMGDLQFRMMVLAAKLNIQNEVAERFKFKNKQVLKWIKENK